MNLPKLAGRRGILQQSIFAPDAVYDFVLQCQEELRPVVSRLPGATHVAQVPEALDLIYIYFEDERSKEKAIDLLNDVPMNGANILWEL